MFRIVYLDKTNQTCHKGGFNQISEALKWADAQSDICVISLLVWNDSTDSFMKIMDL